MFKILSKVSSLSKKQQSFVKTKKIELNDTLPNIQTFVKGVMAFDKEVDAVIGTATLITVLSGLAAFISGGIFISTSNTVFAVVAGLFLIAFIYFLMKRMELGSVNVSDELKLGVYPLLGLMKNDIKKNSNCRISLNLSGPMDGKKKVQTLKIHRGKNYIYKDPWFSGEMLLGDGSKLTWDFEDEVSHKKYSKTNPRGKVKYKSKVKMKSKKTMTLLTKAPNNLQDTRDKTQNSALTIKKKGDKTYLVKILKSKKITNKRKLRANECTDAIKSLFKELARG